MTDAIAQVVYGQGRLDAVEEAILDGKVISYIVPVEHLFKISAGQTCCGCDETCGASRRGEEGIPAVSVIDLRKLRV